jgi:hypothetical protein
MKNLLGVFRQQQKSVFQTFEAQSWQRSLHMTRVAIEFSLCIGGLSSVRKLRRLLKFLEDRSSRNFNRRRSFRTLESPPMQRENSMATRVMWRRVSQDRESLLHMTRVAIEFSLCIGGLSSVRKLRRLLNCLGKEAWCLRFRLDCVRRRSEFGSLSSRNFNRRRLLLYKNGKDWFLASATLLSTVFHRIVNLFST